MIDSEAGDALPKLLRCDKREGGPDESSRAPHGDQNENRRFCERTQFFVHVVLVFSKGVCGRSLGGRHAFAAKLTTELSASIRVESSSGD